MFLDIEDSPSLYIPTDEVVSIFHAHVVDETPNAFQPSTTQEDISTYTISVDEQHFH